VELLVFILAHEAGMRVELFEPAIDHVLDEFAHLVLIEFLDVALLHLVEDIDDELEIACFLLVWGGALYVREMPRSAAAGDADEPAEVPA